MGWLAMQLRHHSVKYFRLDLSLKTLISSISLESVVFNGIAFTHGVPLADYTSVLDKPSRSELAGPAAPYGHRNGLLHFYDDYGLLLREHHATSVIHGIDFILDPLSFRFPTLKGYSGELIVCGSQVHAGMKIKEFASQCDLEFKSHLGHAWYLDGKLISIQVEVITPSRRRGSRKTVIARVAVGFKGANWLSVVR